MVEIISSGSVPYAVDTTATKRPKTHCDTMAPYRMYRCGMKSYVMLGIKQTLSITEKKANSGARSGLKIITHI
jgi:hypothetical protein